MGIEDIKPLRRRRNSLEIIAEILEVVQEGANKTKVMYSTNLSFKQLENYMRFLIEKGFVERVGEKSGKGAVYRTTTGGLKFLEAFKDLDASSSPPILSSKS
ncbi:MAG: winged helix-turn-helix domain-containing protein [Candidatus Bathyarchaeia archaeon]